MTPLRLEILRKQRGLNQTEFSYLIGCCQSRYSDYIRGKRRPSGPRLIRMAAVLNFDGPPETLLEPIPESAPLGAR